MTEGYAVGRIEAYGYMRWVLLAEYLVERVAEAEDGRGIEPLGGDSRRAYQSVVCPVYQGIGIEQEELFIVHGKGSGGREKMRESRMYNSECNRREIRKA